MWVSSTHNGRSIRVSFKNYLNTCNLNFELLMIITSTFFSFNMWEWFLCSVILLIPIVLVHWGRFPLSHTLIRAISAFRDQISILIVGCVTTWSRGSHQTLVVLQFHALLENIKLKELYLILKLVWIYFHIRFFKVSI
jgi:hypothetical protein